MKSLILPLFILFAAARPRSCAAGTERIITGQAVYFITNDAENAVVAIPIGADGTLSGGSVTGSGGQGSTALGADGQPAVPDALVSQSALSLAGQNIFAVNAGSNTLSMLTISPEDPTNLTLIATASIPGEFPNTVAASAENNLVCVGATGAVAGISCASFSDAGLGEMDTLRPIDLGQSTPPVGPTNTVSQVFFSTEGDSLFVTVKGDPAVNNTGFLSVFPVEEDCSAEARLVRRHGQGRGRGGGRKMEEMEEEMKEDVVGIKTVLSQTPVNSSPDGTLVLFGAQPIPGVNDQIFTTDASFGAGILSLASDDTATLVAQTPIDGQAATCWVTISALTGTAFVTDVGVNRVVEMSLEDASIINIADLSRNGNPGLIDLRAAGGFVYALSPGDGEVGAAITVLDVSEGAGTAREVQNFGVEKFAGSNAMGMVVLE